MLLQLKALQLDVIVTDETIAHLLRDADMIRVFISYISVVLEKYGLNQNKILSYL
jgi:hypothetical protein